MKYSTHDGRRSRAGLQASTWASTHQPQGAGEKSYESMAEITAWFDECAISPNDKRKIASDNARRLFGL